MHLGISDSLNNTHWVRVGAWVPFLRGEGGGRGEGKVEGKEEGEGGLWRYKISSADFGPSIHEERENFEYNLNI